MDKNNITVQADLDTRKLEKDLKQFKGSISLTADTDILRKQIDATIKNASKNASISFKCSAPGLNDIIRQTSLAKTQIQSLQQEFATLPQSLNLSVNVDSSGLQQYTAQLEKALQLSSQLNALTLNPITSKSSSNTSISSTFDNAASSGKGFLDVLKNINNMTSLLSAFLGTENIFTSFKDIGANLSQNLD